MIVKNPTDSRIEIQYNGVKYAVEPRGELAGVPADAAKHWQSSIHLFVTIEEEAPRGTPENPMTRKEAVELMGEETVAKIEAEALTVDTLDNLPEDVVEVAAPKVAAKKTSKK